MSVTDSEFLLAPPINRAYSRPCAFLLMRTTGVAYVGKGRQQTWINAAPAPLRCSAWGMCSGGV